MDHPLDEHGDSGMMDVSLSPTRQQAHDDDYLNDLPVYQAQEQKLTPAATGQDEPQLLPVSLPSSMHQATDGEETGANTQDLLVDPLQQPNIKPLATLDTEAPTSSTKAAAGAAGGYTSAITNTAASFVKHMKKLSMGSEDMTVITNGATAAAAAADHPSTSASPSKALVDELELSHQAEDQPLKLWLSDPEKTEGLNKMGMKAAVYYYNIKVDSELPGYPSNSITVRRRFSDFDQLHHMLKAHHHGYFVPPLPEKSFLESKIAMREGFLRVRRVDLQAYIRAVATHPVLRNSEEMHLFLTLSGELSYQPQWVQLVERRASVLDGLKGLIGMPSSSGSSAGSAGSAGSSAPAPGLLPGFMARMKSALGAAPVSNQALSEDELALRAAKEQLRELQQHLSVACSAARTMVRNMEVVCDDLAELGRSFSVMARYEEGISSKLGQYTERGQLATRTAADLQKMGYANLRQHNLWKQYGVRVAASLVFLHDYFIVVPEAVRVLEEREQLLTNLRVLESDVADKQQQLARMEVLANQGQGDARRLANLRTTVASMRLQVTQGQQHYTEVKERNKSELTRLHLERYSDFKMAMAGFAKVQSQLMAAASDIWASAAQLFAESHQRDKDRQE